MALTDDQITAQNFKEFYGQIRPYLNGDSPVCVNQFNKSDLYSTDEKMIGCWIDGKPLYQKAYKLNNLNNGDVQFDSNVNEIDIIVDFKVLPFSDQYNMVQTVGGNSYWPSIAYYHKDTKKIHISVNSSYYSSNSYAIVILQYTKVNDTQVSITDVNDYSTDEYIVGHWIDGKPIYQKTVDCGAAPNGSTNKEIAHGISNLGTTVKLEGVGIIPGNDWIYPVPFSSPTDLSAGITVWANATNIVLQARQDRSNSNIYITIQYTKSSD